MHAAPLRATSHSNASAWAEDLNPLPGAEKKSEILSLRADDVFYERDRRTA
jgi:hypothetical protein